MLSRGKTGRSPRIRAGATLGGVPVSVAISFGFPLTGVGIAVVYAAVVSGGTMLWMIGVPCLALGILAFGSSREL